MKKNSACLCVAKTGKIQTTGATQVGLGARVLPE